MKLIHLRNKIRTGDKSSNLLIEKVCQVAETVNEFHTWKTVLPSPIYCYAIIVRFMVVFFDILQHFMYYAVCSLVRKLNGFSDKLYIREG